jgi:GT2 family glycosyltransferase
MDLQRFINEILIVVVLYKKSCVQTLAEIIPIQSKISVFIYDNGPYAQEITNETVIYRHDGQNNGVSKAYNEASAVALRLHKKWMLLLDQDTVLGTTIFDAFLQGIKMNPCRSVFTPVITDCKGIVSPYLLCWGKGIRLRKIKPGVQRFEKYQIINSGMLIATEAFLQAGGYDERFPLDFSDVAFLERLQVHHSEFVLIHAIGKHHLSINHSKLNLSEAIHRFNIFCKAVKLHQKISKKYSIPALSILPICLKLLFRYKNFNFLKIAIRS